MAQHQSGSDPTLILCQMLEIKRASKVTRSFRLSHQTFTSEAAAIGPEAAAIKRVSPWDAADGEGPGLPAVPGRCQQDSPSRVAPNGRGGGPLVFRRRRVGLPDTVKHR